MANYRLTNLAVNDLTEIWNYTYETWSERQADIYYEQLIDSFNKITIDPKCGRNYEGVIKTLFGLHVNKHIVFYRVLISDEIEITRILHERMDLKRQLA